VNPPGDVAEWLRSGLQSRLHRFDSGRRLLPRSAAVFGGNSEIAIATIEALADDGGLERVVLAVRDPDQATAAARLRQRGLDTRVIPFDADATDSHPQAVDAAFMEAGADGLDLAIVAFAVLGDQDAAKHDGATAVKLAQTNFVGAVSVLTILGERLRAQGHGSIVVLSSVAAERARQANYPYGATKAGLDAFAQGLGDALAPAGVHVLVARPGWVLTKMTADRATKPPPMATDAASVGRDIAAGLRRGAHTVWSPPALRYVFAGMRLLPRSLWRRIRT
jgi:decaprenylphospho-beta-D-erythro-pentofuranosid-2-ulose 2-reductase